MDFMTLVAIGLLGFLAGYSVGKYGEEIVENLRPPMHENDLDELAGNLRQTSKRTLEMAEIVDRLANGEDPDEIESRMSPEMRERWEQFKEEGHVG